MKEQEIDLNQNKKQMKTLACCVDSLALAGYKTQFKVLKNKLQSLSTKKIYDPQDIAIESFYRFEGESDPSDNSILYAIKTDTGEKGTLSDAYGVYSDADVAAFVKEVSEIKKKPRRPHKKIPFFFFMV